MSSARFIIGDTRDVVASLPDGSVDLVLTSPPFLALRSYLPADHPDKHREIGQEPTPAEFLQTLLELAADWRRVLAPHGSIAVELGDTYSGSGGAGGDYNDGGLREKQPEFQGSAARNREGYGSFGGGKRNRNGSQGGVGWPMDKSLCGIPHLFHLSLAYGRNLLTGEDSPAGRWRVRNVVAWCRPNPPVGALGDKFRPATSYMTIATVARDRYFDLDSVRHPNPRAEERGAPSGKGFVTRPGSETAQNEAGAPPLDWWEIPTHPYPGSHYATWPPDLCVKPIKAMCPQKVCRTCGEPSRRITENPNAGTGSNQFQAEALNPNGIKTWDRPHIAERTHLGWTDCGHDDWRNGIVFDPFGGSGTTLAVATGLGRDAIGVDIDERNADLAVQRVGMFLTVEHFGTEAVA